MYNMFKCYSCIWYCWKLVAFALCDSLCLLLKLSFLQICKGTAKGIIAGVLSMVYLKGHDLWTSLVPHQPPRINHPLHKSRGGSRLVCFHAENSNNSKPVVFGPWTNFPFSPLSAFSRWSASPWRMFWPVWYLTKLLSEAKEDFQWHWTRRSW